MEPKTDLEEALTPPGLLLRILHGRCVLGLTGGAQQAAEGELGEGEGLWGTHRLAAIVRDEPVTAGRITYTFYINILVQFLVLLVCTKKN